MNVKYNIPCLFIFLLCTITIEAKEVASTLLTVHSEPIHKKEQINKPQKLKFNWPYMISIEHLLNDTHREICGGVLVHPRYILTSNSCLNGHGKTNNIEADENEVQNNILKWGQYMAVSSGEAKAKTQNGITHKNSQREILAIRLINFWVPYSEYRRNPINDEMNADVAVAITEYNFPINLRIQPHSIRRSKQYAQQQIPTDFKFCRLIHWSQRIIDMRDMKSSLSLTVSPVDVVNWKSCETSSFVDEWSHVCIQLYDGSARTLMSSGGPLVCSNVVVATMSPNAHMVRNPNSNRLNITLTKVDNFFAFISAIINEVDLPYAAKTASNANSYKSSFKISNYFLNILIITFPIKIITAFL